MTLNLYWGDLHSHCAISYGHGTIEQAFLRARQQLDFCSVTGHAFWPDMPSDRERYGKIMDYHTEGFARLAGNWSALLEAHRAATDASFVALPSFEWHSLEYGDHNVYGPAPDLLLQDAATLELLREAAASQNAILVPHHIGYAAGYRGIDWRHFRSERSPFVEIFSLHGCSESDTAPYPMLHDMGPRDYGSTAEAGWEAGHRFGLVGGTDHHGAYPGSHGDGRMGVLASSLTPASLWEAFLARRVYAATGDGIEGRLWLDDAEIGSEVHAPQSRSLRVQVRGWDALDRVELLKNGRLLRSLAPTPSDPASLWQEDRPETFRLRITWGWGRKDQPVPWQARLVLSEGRLNRVDSCFSGQTVAAPQGVGGHQVAADEEDLPHAILEQDENSCTWRSVTTGNSTLRHSTTQALSLELEAGRGAMLGFEVNGQRFSYSLQELVRGSRVRYLRGWLSEALHVGRLVPLEETCLEAELRDDPQENTDRYYLRIRQRNDHWAWLSPIWADR